MPGFAGPTEPHRKDWTNSWSSGLAMIQSPNEPEPDCHLSTAPQNQRPFSHGSTQDSAADPAHIPHTHNDNVFMACKV